LGGKDGEDDVLRLGQEKVRKTPISTNKLGIVVCFCNPSYAGGQPQAKT
jgi:hypothetical protein